MQPVAAARRAAEQSFPSFPSCTWERYCRPQDLVFAKFHFALIRSAVIPSRSAVQLPQQVRSQVQLGNEGIMQLLTTKSARPTLNLQISDNTFPAGIMLFI